MRRSWLKIVSSATSSNTDCICRAGRHAGAAARAGSGIDFCHGRSAQTRAETDRRHRAAIAANPAFHTALCEAAVGDSRLDLPGRGLGIGARQGAIPARQRTGSAKRAFAVLEIHFRVAAHDNDDLRRTDGHACATASAGIKEGFFGQRPWRALRPAGRLEITAEKLSAIDHAR